MPKSSFDQCLTLVDLSYSQVCDALSDLQHLSGAIGYPDAYLLARQACKDLATLQDRLQELCAYHIEV